MQTDFETVSREANPVKTAIQEAAQIVASVHLDIDFKQQLKEADDRIE